MSEGSLHLWPMNPPDIKMLPFSRDRDFVLTSWREHDVSGKLSYSAGSCILSNCVHLQPSGAHLSWQNIQAKRWWEFPSHVHMHGWTSLLETYCPITSSCGRDRPEPLTVPQGWQWHRLCTDKVSYHNTWPTTVVELSHVSLMPSICVICLHVKQECVETNANSGLLRIQSRRLCDIQYVK